MPELPEVETVRRGLALKMSGRRILQAELRRPDLRPPFPPAPALTLKRARLDGKITPIKSALLDQRIVAGLGNIYVCEALFRAGVSPRRLAASISRGRADRLVAGIRSVLTEAIEAGGSSLRDYVQADGELGYFQHRWAGHGPEGDPCPGCDL